MAILYERLAAIEHALGGRTVVQAAYEAGIPVVADVWKTPVATVSDLPVENNTDGDARVALDTHALHIWNEGGSAWQQFDSGGGGGPVTTIVQDSFTDTDGTDLAGHTGEVGASWTIHPQDNAGHTTITDNKIRAAGENFTTYFASGVPPSADYEVSASFVGDAGGGSEVGIWARLSPTDLSGYCFVREFSVNTLSVVNQGTFTALGSDNTHLGNETLTLKVSGDTISVLDGNGDVLITATDGSFTDAGRVGVRNWYNGVNNAQCDNLLATTLGS